MHPFGRQRVGQQVGEIGAVEVIVRRTEGLLDQSADGRALQGAAVVPAALVHGLRKDADPVHGRAQAEPMEQPRGVGADLDAGADLADARRLLVDLHVEAGLQQMQRGGEPADAAADDGHFHCRTCRHTASPSSHRLPRQATCVSGRTSTSFAS